MAACQHEWVRVAPLKEPRRGAGGKVEMVTVGQLEQCVRCGRGRERR